MSEPLPRVVVFGPHPVLTVTLEREGEQRESVHFHAGGQGVWVARMVAALGATPVLCGFVGGESGALVRALLERLGGELCLVETATPTGSYVTDRRSGERQLVGMALSDPPSRHEVDELFSRTCAEAIAEGWLVVANPLPDESLPLEIYGDLVADARAGGARVLVDLSSPRLDSALRGRPDLVKLNDWQLAQYVSGPVERSSQLRAAAERLRAEGAGAVIVTRGEQPGLLLSGEGAWELTPPQLVRGFREGCGDAMMGALAASWAGGATLQQAVRVGAAAGAANFMRRGLGGASRATVERLLDSVALMPLRAMHAV